MNGKSQYLISKDNGKLQIPYAEYVSLMEKIDEIRRIQRVKSEVLANLVNYLKGQPAAKASPNSAEPKPAKVEASTPAPKPEPATPAKPVAQETAASSAAKAQEETAAPARTKANVEIPPIKKEIAAHFNAQDESGRLFNVFKQYYTCLNEACGGTVRVTMKDGVFSLWNYDEWEEFAFVDIFEGELRFALDQRYTDELSSLNFCEGSRLLSSRRNLLSIQVGDLNKTMLKVLAKAFKEVGHAMS